MKKILTVLIVLMITAPALIAQETLRDVVRDYQKNNSEFTLVIPSFLIKIGVAYGDMDEEEREVLEMIDDMKIVICENNFRNSDLPLLEEGIQSGKFAEVMTIIDGKEKIRMIMNKKTKRKSEMLMLVENDNENVLMLFNFHGEPDFKKFMSLAD